MPELEQGIRKSLQVFTERSGEIRARLIWSVVCVAVAAVVGYALVPTVLRVLTAGMPKVIFLTPAGPLNVKLKLSIALGMIFAIPLLEWQLMRLIAPYLPAEARRLGYRLIPVSTFLFFAGLFFAYIGIYPFAMKFFLTFHPPGLDPMLTVESVVSFALVLFIPAASVFEMPILLYFLARAGILKPDMMTKNWKISIFILFIVASVVTPSPELISTFLIFIPMLVMYFGSIFAVRAVWKRKAKQLSTMVSTGEITEEATSPIKDDSQQNRA